MGFGATTEEAAEAVKAKHVAASLMEVVRNIQQQLM